jgi:MSHA pilin protein MshC
MICSHGIQKGFTLIEIIMTLVVLGVISISFLPKFAQQSKFSERVFFDDVLNAVRYAQKHAMVTGCKVQVSISTDRYRLNSPVNRSECNVATPTFSRDIKNPGTGEASYTGGEPGVTLNSSAPLFSFDALGRASSDVSLTVAGSKTISVLSKTGFVYDSTP